MYDMYVFKGTKHGRINETAVRHWLTNFTGKIIKTKFFENGKVVILYKKAEFCKEETEKGIGELKDVYYKKTGLLPTHLIIGIEEIRKLENSNSLLKRLKYIKDTTQGLLGSCISGLTIIASKDIKGIQVAYLC